MTLGFDALPGNDALKASLRTALDRRFPQAVLLSGPDGSGKSALAQALAAALLCTGPAPRPCGACASCHKISHGTHPDLIIVDEGEGEIKVETARRIRDEAAVLPNDGDRKVFIILHADWMNPSAQNALLKVLEEPPRYVFFLLASSQPGALLQTIRSRCTAYQLAPPSTAQLPDDPALLESARAFLRALTTGDEYGMLLGANGFSKLAKAPFREAMSLLQAAVRDAALSLAGTQPLVPSLAAETRALAGALTADKLIALYDHLALLSRRAEGNASAPIQCAVLAAGAYSICHPPRSHSRRAGNRNGGTHI